jgi:hypothetical protein
MIEAKDSSFLPPRMPASRMLESILVQTISDTFQVRIIGARAEKQRLAIRMCTVEMMRLRSADPEQISSNGRDTCRIQGAWESCKEPQLSHNSTVPATAGENAAFLIETECH